MRYIVLLFAATLAYAQTDVLFRSSTQLVVETVVVKDKSGKHIEGLTAKDFTITEDGAPQAIKFFEFQKVVEQDGPIVRHVRHFKRPHVVEELFEIAARAHRRRSCLCF